MAYPSSLDELTDGVPSDGAAPTTALGDVTYPHDDHHRALATAVEAVEAELGTDPSGSSSTVKARLDGVDLRLLPVDPAAALAAMPSFSVASYAGNSILLDWDAHPAATMDGGLGHYEIQAALDSGFSVVVRHFAVEGTEHQRIADGSVTPPLYFRIKAVDYYGNESPWLAATGNPLTVTELTASSIDGLGDAATKNVGTAAGTVAAGNDSRFTDSRAPSGSAGGDLAGTYPNPTLATSGVSAATYGSAGLVPVLTVDTKGRVTSASTSAINGVVPLKSGWYAVAAGGTDTLVIAGALFYAPLLIEKACTVDRIGLEVTGAGAATCVIRLGIYADDGGVPGSLIIDAGTIDGTSATYQEITISQALSVGRIWLTCVQQVTGTPTVRANRYGPGVPMSSSAQLSGAAERGSLRVSAGVPSGALPSTAAAPNDFRNAAPRIALRIA